MYSVNVVSFLLKDCLWECCCFLEMAVIKAKINKIGVTIGIASNLAGNEIKPLSLCIFVHVRSWFDFFPLLRVVNLYHPNNHANQIGAL